MVEFIRLAKVSQRSLSLSMSHGPGERRTMPGLTDR